MAGPRPVVISGPSGAGKSTLIKKLLKEYEGVFGFSVSHTTRSPRPGEESGKDYHYVSREVMQAGIDNGEFLEHVEFSENMYGTSKAAVQDIQARNLICILDIDMQGVKSLKRTDLDPIYVSIQRPIHILEKCLRDRKTESEESLQTRLRAALVDMETSKEPGLFDVVIVFDNLEGAYGKLKDALCEEITKVKKANMSPLLPNLQAYTPALNIPPNGVIVVMHVTQELELYPEHCVTQLLFKDVKNVAELRQSAVEGKLTCALITPTMLVNPLQVLVAANKAVHLQKTGKMKTRGLYSEIIFNLSPTNNISEAFKRFGVSDSDDSVHVTVVHSREESHVVSDISSRVDGQQLPVEHMAMLTDTAKVKKLYKVTPQEEKCGTLLDALICRMATKDVL